MRILVTGGGGFLGLALSRALAARGDEVILFDSTLSAPAHDLARGRTAVTLRTGDIADMSNVCRVFRDDRPDAVIHCAAVVGVIASLGSPAGVFRVNLQGTINLLEAMDLYGVRRVIHISSEETYGAFQSPRATEDHPMNPLYAYGISKVAVEHLAHTYELTRGTECINVRTSWVYGPGFPRMRVPRDLLEAALQGRSLHLPAGADSAIDHTYVDDFVDGTLRALDHADHPYRAYHIASDSAPTVAEMVGIIRDLVPGADISAGPGVYCHAGTVPIPAKGALDCSRAREVFGYRPRFDLRAGLAAWIDHYRSTR